MIIVSVLLLLLYTKPQIVLPETLSGAALFHLPILFATTADSSDFVHLSPLRTRNNLRMLVEDA